MSINGKNMYLQRVYQQRTTAGIHQYSYLNVKLLPAKDNVVKPFSALKQATFNDFVSKALQLAADS